MFDAVIVQVTRPPVTAAPPARLVRRRSYGCDGVTVRPMSAVSTVTGDDVRELVVAVTDGGSGRDRGLVVAVAVGIAEQGDDDAVDAGFRRILEAVAVAVEPDTVADRAWRRRCGAETEIGGVELLPRSQLDIDRARCRR